METEKFHQCFDCPDGVQIFSTEDELMAHKWDMIRTEMSREHMNCHICGMKHRTFEGLIRHYQLSHPAKQKLACPGCRTVFPRLHLLMDHMEGNDCPNVTAAQVGDRRMRKALAAAAAGNASSAASEIGIFDVGGRVPAAGYGQYMGLDVPPPPADPKAIEDGRREAIRQGGSGRKSRPAMPSQALVAATATATTFARTAREFRHGDSKLPDLLTDSPADGRHRGLDSIGSPADHRGSTAPKNRSQQVSLPGSSAEAGSSLDPNHPSHPDFDVFRYKNRITGRFNCPHMGCRRAGKSFKSASGFITHLRSDAAHTSLRVQCPSCSRYFTTIQALVQHSESQSARCHLRDSEEFHHFLDTLTGGMVAVQGRNIDLTVAYEVQPGAVRDLLPNGEIPVLMDGDRDDHDRDRNSDRPRPFEHFEQAARIGEHNDDGHHRHHGHHNRAMLLTRRLARRVERSCCLCAHYFPLAFVIGLSSWACWVMLRLGSRTRSEGSSSSDTAASWVGPGTAAAAVVLYVLQMWSYGTAVLTAPGSTTDDHGYSTVPPTAMSGSGNSHAGITVKSNGELRFCKKCQARKPDRAHHCSTCRRCVLKMDHHCPWLATCVGLHNAKAFVLFLVYTTLLAWLCLAASTAWVWTEVVNDTTYDSYDDSLMPIQYIMLCVISGIIGLVLGLFTGWHIYLACRGQTTIECMEKTRYQSPLRQSAGGGWSGKTGGGGAFRLGRRLTYDQMERYRAQKRHQEYLDEQDGKLLPHAFDLGARQNLLHLLGPQPWLWALPVCNTTGDGWSWEPSPRWLAARDGILRDREAQKARERAAGWGPVEEEGGESLGLGPGLGLGPEAEDENGYSTAPTAPPRYDSTTSATSPPSRFSTSKADRILGRDPRLYSDETPRRAAAAAAAAAAAETSSAPVFSMQRLTTSGRALRRGQLPRILNDSILDGSDTDVDSDDEEERREKAKDEAAAAEARRRLHQQTHQALAPLRARWLPQPQRSAGASGLLLRQTTAAVSSSSLASSAATSPLVSPSRESSVGPAGGVGSVGTVAAGISTADSVSIIGSSDSRAADTDDGGVD
ncbi:dhhc zinc finger membrane protein [Grosmannia clavigera kw1407]|uniref:Dhhc zinc finger membrane protein n=1 Tax=Grosmannia clavigera (strain kw1407 / UAMH 11150) TaxID=655863 RepID=F0XRH1_GROCL|nr:dhhc zinc finger membrane protein [Grosmannia clavigera kw1407]EFW99734.1 dhhc zinc finger membrane protein [Grosmannia clavigera kw1407]